MRRLRCAKIVATSWTCLGQRRHDRKTVCGRRRCLPRQYEPHHSVTAVRELVAMIRAVERDTGRPIGVLVDLQGPKLRLGTFDGGSAMVKTATPFRARHRSIQLPATPSAPSCPTLKFLSRSSPATRC